MNRRLRKVAPLLLISCLCFSSGCAAVAIGAGIVYGIHSIDKAHKQKQARLAARQRVAAEQAVQREEQERLAELAATKVREQERQKQFKIAKKRQKEEQAERNRLARLERKRQEENHRRQLAHKREAERLAKSKRQRQIHIARQVQQAQDLIGAMEQDIRRHVVDPGRYIGFYQGFADSGVPESVQQEYEVVRGLYSWHLYLRTGDRSWKTSTEESFREAKLLGRKDVFCICPSGWTVDSKIIWEDEK